MPLVRPDESVLLVIDVQENFYEPERADIDRQRLAAVVDRVAWVTGLAAALEVPVVVTEEDAETNGHTFPQIVDRLPASAVTLPKAAFSAADNEEILQAVKGSGASTAALVGLETDICVAHSALRLIDGGWRVVAVEDAMFSPNAAHGNGIRRMSAAGVELLSSKELFYDWLPTVTEARAFRRTHGADLALPTGVVL